MLKACVGVFVPRGREVGGGRLRQIDYSFRAFNLGSIHATHAAALTDGIATIAVVAAYIHSNVM